MKIEIDGKSIYECSIDELREVQKEVKLAWNLNSQRQALQFRPGMSVSFEHKGGVITGKVEKVNQKSVSVKDDNSHRGWNVSPQLLTIIENVSV